MSRKQKKVLYRIIAAFAITMLGVWIPIGDAAKGAVMLLAYGIIGYDILISALKGLIYGRVLNENLLMSVATIGAIAIAIYDKSGNFTEAVAVMLLYQTGELFQSCAVGKSRKNITALMDIRPDYANLETDGKIERVSPELVKTGSIIVVRPGEKIPIDAIVIEGDSCIDTSALTGESVPREVKCGSEVMGGCINMTGVLKIRTTKEFKESTVAKILELVEKSGLHKAKSEKFISKFARIYTPVVFAGAVILAAMPPIINMIVGRGADFAQWIYRALTFLVISCPCALVISIPLSFFAGMGGAGKAGVLIKGANFIEALAKTETVVFDKTGTLTKGSFEVLGMHHNTINKEDLIEYAALAESASSHPVGKSLQAACKCELDLGRVTEINEIGGNGVVARIDGKRVAIGNNKLMESLGVDYITCHGDGTICHIAIDGEYQGHIVVADAIKETAALAIAELKKIGIKKIVMLTGDLQKNAEAVGKKISIADIIGGLLPTDKVSEVEKLLEKKSKKGKLLFIGDGINDAPVLKRADIGVAMGALGSDAAIEAADVVLMDDNPRKIATAIRIARRCVGIVYQNIIFALGIKLLCLALGAIGIADMWLAIFADVGVMVIAVLNALRALYYPKA